MKLHKETLKRIIKEEIRYVLNETTYSPTNELDMLITRVEASDLSQKQKERLISLLQGPPEDVEQGKELAYALPSVNTDFDDLDNKLMSKQYEIEYDWQSKRFVILTNQLKGLIGHILDHNCSSAESSSNCFTVHTSQWNYVLHPERIMNAHVKVPVYVVTIQGEESKVREAFDILVAEGRFKVRNDPGTHYVGDDETYVAILDTIPTEREMEDAANRYLIKTFNRPDPYNKNFKGTDGEWMAAQRDAAYMKRLMSKLKK
jgi:hypothetical protein